MSQYSLASFHAPRTQALSMMEGKETEEEAQERALRRTMSDAHMLKRSAPTSKVAERSSSTAESPKRTWTSKTFAFGSSKDNIKQYYKRNSEIGQDKPQ